MFTLSFFVGARAANSPSRLSLQLHLTQVQEVSSLRGRIRSIRAAVSGIVYPIQFAVMHIYQGNSWQPDITENPFVCSD